MQFTYDRSDQPTAISGAATGSFVYDAHNRRVKQTLDGETIYSVYGVDGTLIHRDNVTTGETTDYLRLGQSGPTLVRLKTQAGVVTPTYTHNDHLGSASMGTSAGGSILWFESYTPFGEPLQNRVANEDNQGHTGHIHDTATGLTYMQARYYDPVIGRFLSNDPVGFASGGAGFFNRYAYTFNDPVNLVDPTGMCSTGTRLKDRETSGCETMNFNSGGGGSSGGGSARQESRRGGSPSEYRLTYSSDWAPPCSAAGNGINCASGHNVEAFYVEAQLGPPGVAELVGGRISQIAEYGIRRFRLTARERAAHSLEAGNSALGDLAGALTAEGVVTITLRTGQTPSGWRWSGRPYTNNFRDSMLMPDRHNWQGVWITPDSGMTRIEFNVVGGHGANVRVTAFPAHSGAAPRGCGEVGICSGN